MNYVIENEQLRVTVASHGAEVVSVVSKKTGDECIWGGDPSVWGRHAPILFPYTGKLTGGEMIVDGRAYPGKQHGFARDVEHALAEQTDERLVLELRANDRTKELFPFDFVLRSIFTLDGNTLRHTLEVENPADETLYFGVGYHPAFVCPFDDKHDTEDYEFRFDRMESPLVIDARPNGLLSGRNYYLGANIDRIQLTDRLFDNDSYCMVNLKSSTLGIYEKDSDRSVVCSIESFPYTLIWSQLTEKIKFVCIEPWNSLPGAEDGSKEWKDRPAAAALKKGEQFRTTLATTFNR